MKKLLTLLAAAVLLVASASAQNKLVRSPKLTKQNVAMSLNKKGNRVFSPMAAASKAAPAASLFAKQLAKNAPKTAYNVTCSSWGSTYYEEDNDWYTLLIDVNETFVFYFDIIADSIVPGQTYTLANMIPDYSFVRNYDLQADAPYSAATFTYDIDEDGLEYINATATDVDGNTYTISYHELPIPTPQDTIDLVMSTVQMYDAITELGAVQFMGVNGSYQAGVTVHTDALIGNYSNDDIWYDYTFLKNGDDGVVIRLADAQVIAATNGDRQGYQMDAYLTCQDSHCYHLTFTYFDPVALDTVDITATNLIVELNAMFAQFGLYMYDITASNQDYSAYFSVFDSPLGTFAISDLYAASLTTTDGTDLAIYDGSITIAQDQDGQYSLTGSILCYGDVLYNLNFSLYVPDQPTRTVNINIPEGELVDFISDYGLFQAMGYTVDRSYIASFTVNTYDIPGTYSFSDFDMTYTYVDANPDDEDNYIGFRPVAGNCTVTVDPSTGRASINGSLFCYNPYDPTDFPMFNITMSCGIHGPTLQYDADEDDFSATFAANEVEVDDQYREQYGEVVIDAEKADGTMAFIAFMVDPSASETIPAGVYTIDDSQEMGTVIASPGVQNGSVYPSFTGYLDEEGYLQPPLWFMVDGTVTVVNNNGQWTATVDATNSYGRNIDVTINFNNGVGIDNVNASAISLYPNPANDVINVIADGVQQIDILDAAGRTVMSANKAGAINISALANGVYMVRTITNGSANVQKIVKK